MHLHTTYQIEFNRKITDKNMTKIVDNNIVFLKIILFWFSFVALTKKNVLT